MLKSILCHFSVAYLLSQGTIIVANTAAADTDPNNTNKAVIFKSCTLLIKNYNCNKQHTSR